MLHTDDVSATWYIAWKKSWVFAYVSTPAITTITVGNTYYPVAWTFTNAVIENFTAVWTPAIRYDWSATQYFEVDRHATVKTNHNSCTVSIWIKKWWTLVAGSEMTTLCKTALEHYNISWTCVVSLATNNEIQLVVTADTNGDEVTCDYFTTTINEFFD